MSFDHGLRSSRATPAAQPLARLLAHSMGLAALVAGAACGSGGSGGEPSAAAAPSASAPAPAAPAETAAATASATSTEPPASTATTATTTPAPASATPPAAPVENLEVAAPPLALGASEAAETRHVLVVSIDGLRSDVLENEAMLARLPALTRLLRGAHTLDARTDPDYTITLPNHVSMVTGRPVAGLVGHRWTGNDDPKGMKDGGTLHAHRGEYVASMFDVAHDAGVATTVVASKTKFWLLEQSYNWSTGEPDRTEPDHGRAKIDCFVFAERSADVGRMAAARLASAKERSLSFVHFAAPDIAGHSFDWKVEPGSAYILAIEEVDAALAELLATIDATPTLAGATAIVVTADHGGGVPRKTHTDMSCPLNFRIPFLVWTGDRTAEDLFALNAGRPRPGREERIARDAARQPIRNGDAGNLALRLLELPPIAGSRYGR
jgi:hypothetical protein